MKPGRSNLATNGRVVSRGREDQTIRASKQPASRTREGTNLGQRLPILGVALLEALRDFNEIGKLHRVKGRCQHGIAV